MTETMRKKPRTKRDKSRPADIPIEFRELMEERKQKYGVNFQFTLKLALDFAIANRAEWDPFF